MLCTLWRLASANKLNYLYAGYPFQKYFKIQLEIPSWPVFWAPTYIQYASTCHSKNWEHSKYISSGAAGCNQLSLTFQQSTSGALLPYFLIVGSRKLHHRKENGNCEVSGSCTKSGKWKEDQCTAETVADCLHGIL